MVGGSQTTVDVLRGLGFMGRGSQAGGRGQHQAFAEDNPEVCTTVKPVESDCPDVVAPDRWSVTTKDNPEV